LPVVDDETVHYGPIKTNYWPVVCPVIFWWDWPSLLLNHYRLHYRLYCIQGSHT